MKKELAENESLDSVLRKGAPPPSPAVVSGGGVLDEAEAGRRFGRAGGDDRADLLRSIHLRVRAELGRCRMLLKDALELAPGSVLDLEKLADEPIDLYVNELLVARGEVVVANDCYCIRITEVVPSAGEVEP